ncbi:unnamed protein product [Brassica oleracea]
MTRENQLMELPCGLTLGSHVTLVGRPRKGHPKEGDGSKLVSQFVIELQGLKTVDGEDPPRILHFNPRLKGDWSRKPVIEQNTCYRMQWGSSQRCEGWRSRDEEETVDSHVKCEKWIRDDDNYSEGSRARWWLNRLIGRRKRVKVEWPFPFVEEKLFVLTLSAGLEGYHINVDGQHVTSFPYRTGFTLEDATGLTVNGDIDVHSVVVASLPTSHPSFAPQRHLELSKRWQAPLVPDGPVELFYWHSFCRQSFRRKDGCEEVVDAACSYYIFKSCCSFLCGTPWEEGGECGTEERSRVLWGHCTCSLHG